MSQPPTSDLKPRAQAALTDSSFVDLRDLKVELIDDRLVITGTVSSFYHKQLAQEVVRAVAGCVGVVNRVNVT